MSEHLPECYLSGSPSMCPRCDALRACERRVREAEFPCDNHVGPIALSCSHYWQGERDGLQAARDAVAAVGVRKDTSHDMRVQALAAIDALRATNP